MNEKKLELLVLPAVKNMSHVVAKIHPPITLTKGTFRNLKIIFNGNTVEIFHKEKNLNDFSFVWLSSSWTTRDLAFAAQIYLEQSGVPHTQVEKGTSKITDQMFFSMSGIQSPATLFFGGKKITKEGLEQIEDLCGYPLIIKDIKGSRGSHSELAENSQDLLQKIEKLPRHKKFIFQKFIPNEYDWGILVANGKVVSGEKRYHSEGEFRNNICKGGTEVFVDLDKIPFELKQIAVRANNALGLSWSRSDIIIDQKTQKPFLMEVNRLPGITPLTTEVEGAYEFLSSRLKSFAV